MTPVQRPSAARVATSLGAVAALFGALPIALTQISRARFMAANPLSGIAVPWEWSGADIRRSLEAPLRDDAVVNLIVRTSLAVIWVAIAVIAISVIVEVVHMRRHHGLAVPRVRGLGWSQGVARWIAAGLIGLMPLSSFTSLASAGSAERPDEASLEQLWSDDDRGSVDPDVAPEFDRASNSSVSPGWHPREVDAAWNQQNTAANSVHVVERGDSVYAIAAALAGGDDRRTIELADQILDLNLGHTMRDGDQFSNPALILPGWELQLPASLDTDTTPDNSGPTPSTEHSAEADGTYLVVPGDSLSSIAAAHLGDADDWTLIWGANSDATMADGTAFTDPNLVVPGWRLQIPSATAPPSATAADDTTGLDPVPLDDVPTINLAEDEPDVESTSTTAPHTPATTPTTASSPATPPSSTAPNSTPSSTSTSSTSTTTTVMAGGDTGPNSQWADPDEVAPQAPTPLGIEHAALLAAGILTVAGVRRRRRLRASTPHARVPTPPPEVAAIERRLRSIDPGERGARIDVATRAIAHHLVSAGSDAQIGTIRAAADGELCVRLTSDAALDGPWVADAMLSQSWMLPAAVPIEMLSENARQSGNPCHALVTIGVDTQGSDVLIDLEAAGLTVVEAPPGRGDDIVRAVACGLASSLTSEVAHLVVARLDADVLLDHPNARVAPSVDAAILETVELVGSTSSNVRTTFDLRARRTGGEMWEPVIALFADADEATGHRSLGDIPPQGHGVAVVAVARPGGETEHCVGARLAVHHEEWLLDAFGEQVPLVPIGVQPADMADIDQLLDDADQPVEDAPLTIAERGKDLTSIDLPTFEPMEHDIVVSMIGDVKVSNRNGEPATFERSKTLELIAWLATHRERATRSAARTALWELDVRDATFANVVSEARRGLARLVQPADGDEWLARTLTESLPLHDRVVTDADLARERLEHVRLAPPSQAIEVLRPAAELIRAMPFAGTNYLWPDADGLTSELVLLATTVSAELAGHALSLGDTDLVFWATQRGLAVLPGHEELIGLRMRAHARAGDLAGVRQEWESYERVITADSWSDGEPAPKLLDLRRALLSP